MNVIQTALIIGWISQSEIATEGVERAEAWHKVTYKFDYATAVAGVQMFLATNPSWDDRRLFNVVNLNFWYLKAADLTMHSLVRAFLIEGETRG